MSAPDTRQPIFDPGLDVATVVFSHVRCVKTRVNLAVVSKLWREASKPAAAYPLEFEFDAGSRNYHGGTYVWDIRDAIELLDNDEALSLPYERVIRLLGEAAKYGSVYTAPSLVCDYAARRGSLRLLKWTRENNCVWSARTCHYAAYFGQLPALQYSHENGCPWDRFTCSWAAQEKHWDCLQYAVDNKCPGWEKYAKTHAKHLR
jgi:hypothetical protein